MSARSIGLWKLPQEINDCVYTSSKYPLVIDPTGQAIQFLKYRSRHLSALRKGDFENESLRRALVQGLHNGAWMLLDFDRLACDLAALFSEDNFPKTALNPHELFLEETYRPLLRNTDEFTAKVTYEHQEALAQGAFQDRTKAHAPERVADIDKRFDPKDAFRIIVATKQEDVPAELFELMTVLKVEVSEQQIKDNSGVWAGGERPKERKSKEQVQMDNDLLESAFDGEVDTVKELLEKGADPMAKDGRMNTSLAEAAVNGHLAVVKVLLEWKKPIGCDPNAQGSDGRSPLHRAAFQGHHEVVQLLLESGSDPRLKDRNLEKPFDMASNDETRNALTGWDEAKTDKLKEERKAALDAEDEKLVQNEEERIALERRRKMQKLSELVEQGEKDLLEMELMDVERDQIASYRDDRGNNVLHLAAVHGKLDCVIMLIDELGVGVNTREAKGWTPVAIAAFHGHKKVCQALMQRKADPSAPNAYRKTAYDVAKDDEIRQALTAAVDGPSLDPVASLVAELDDTGAASSAAKKSASSSSLQEGDGDGEGSGAKAKAKGKAKAKAKSAAAEPKAKAKAGAAPKARGKSRPR